MLFSLPNGHKVQVTHSGQLRINDNLTLSHVLLVPHFNYNLQSVRMLIKQLHCQVIFSEYICTLQGLSLRRSVEIGREAYDLYILDKTLIKDTKFDGSLHDFCSSLSSVQNTDSKVFYNQGSRELNFDVWHRRVGHIPYRRMKFLSLGTDFDNNTQYLLCEVCPKAKQQRLPFKLSTIYTSNPFELVHIDSWEPYHTKTHAGHRFFLTIVDNYIRATWTHLMVTKDVALGLIKSFVKMAKTQCSGTVKAVRTDNTLELSTGLAALEFFANTGILHQTSCVQTPQQNRIMERKHKHLLEVSRALLF